MPLFAKYRWTPGAPGVLLAAMLVLAPLGLAGCKSTSPPRRVPPGETTDAELNDPRQQPVSLTEFRDSAAADILQQLPVMPEIADAGGPVTILMGDINNKTGLVSTADYEYVASGIRSRLIRANASRDKLHFVEQRARVENLAARERVATAPAPGEAAGMEIQWAGGQYYVPDYDASKTFGLSMDVYRINRGNTNLYYTEVQIFSFATNRIVHSFQSEMKQVSR